MLVNQAITQFIHNLVVIDRSRETVKGYKAELSYFNHFLTTKHNGPVYLEDVELSDLEEYMLSLKNRGVSTATRNRVVYVLRSFYNYCCKRELCEKNHAVLLEPVKVVQKERDFITEEELQTLITKIPQPVIRTVIQTMFYTGGRITEMKNLKLQDVDLENSVLHIIEGKGKKDRDVPISRTLHVILTNYIENIREHDDIETDFFFAIPKSGTISGNYVNRLLKEAVEELGWDKHITAHVLRHSFGTNLLEKGASLVSIQKLLGHANLTVTSRYLHQDKDKLAEAVNLL
ncbi:tyrosine-type recombinase/integrase [Alkalihalobacillus oceani]|uniref:tyrosine-type recombinase/integrase n=1 Tax=Halalkalibacter oceani TaxID=1653776 RepID=UPI002040A70F|nr:tyrosine-type recombinase/integrase [Halalkalibacter oceani]MCM3761025.1 tyrosine-type recombinase/integrase [Halalkalibacter oceani]